MKKILIITIMSVLLISLVGCAKSDQEKKEGKDTDSPNTISAEIADEIVEFSKTVVMNEIYARWSSGKDYGTHIIDTYTSDHDNILIMNLNKDGSMKEITISNVGADMDAMDAFISLVICILNNERFGFTDDEMHEIGYGIMDEDGGILGETPYSLDTERFKVTYVNEESEDLKTRSLRFCIKFL